MNFAHTQTFTLNQAYVLESPVTGQYSVLLNGKQVAMFTSRAEAEKLADMISIGNGLLPIYTFDNHNAYTP